MKKVKGSKGITLIALVITVIVLLILAGVTIAAISGNNGILIRTQEAKNKTEQAEKDEKEKLGDIEDILNEYATGQTVEQVTDENPGVLEGTGTDVDPYTINSIEDLVVFASNVREGNTYEGQTVKLGLSLDFNSNKSYVDPLRTDYGKYGYDGELKTLLTTGDGFRPIGVSNNTEQSNYSFKGIFDGSENIIYNLYIDVSKEDNTNDLRVGFFGNNYGIVKKLGMSNCNISMNFTSNSINTAMAGGICGVNYNNIESCFVTGNFIGNAFGTAKIYIGGISGSNNNATISSNYSNAKINIAGNSMILSGGISSNNFGTSHIEKCYSSSEIMSVGNQDEAIQRIGGIVGSNTGNISYCYNIGNLSTQGIGKSHLGGIIGYSEGNINNSYNNGSITSNVETLQNDYLGEIVGLASSTSSVENCGYNAESQNSGIGVNNGTGDSSELLEMPEIISVIGDEFKNISGVILLKWQ